MSIAAQVLAQLDGAETKGFERLGQRSVQIRSIE